MKKVIISLLSAFLLILLLETQVYADVISTPSDLEIFTSFNMVILFLVLPILFCINFSFILLNKTTKTSSKMNIFFYISYIVNLLFPIFIFFEYKIFILLDLLLLCVPPIFIYKKYENISIITLMVSMITNFITFSLIIFIK